MQRHPRNSLIELDQVVPSAPGYRVRGAFNPAAIRFDGEVLLLLRVAEDCPARADLHRATAEQLLGRDEDRRRRALYQDTAGMAAGRPRQGP